MPLIAGMLQELEQEAAATRRILERVPDRQLGWRPHPKSRTLGQLALHIAVVPGSVAEFVAAPSPVQAPQFGTDPSPASSAELISMLDQSIAKAKQVLGGMDDATLMATWRMMQGDREIMALPRAAMLRSVMLNHWYHHRGQLTVYLRELDVPLPSIYGPTADENPFQASSGRGPA
jgi:uncharacterized damage-inducible protein DinB